jgi:hypothetical protein
MDRQCGIIGICLLAVRGQSIWMWKRSLDLDRRKEGELFVKRIVLIVVGEKAVSTVM